MKTTFLLSALVATALPLSISAQAAEKEATTAQEKMSPDVAETSIAQGVIKEFDRENGTITLQTRDEEVPVLYYGAKEATYKSLDGEKQTFDAVKIAVGQHAILFYGNKNDPESKNPHPVLVSVELIPEPKEGAEPVATPPSARGTGAMPKSAGKSPISSAAAVPAKPTSAPAMKAPMTGKSETAIDALLDGDPTTTSDENSAIDGDITTNPGN